MVRGCSCLDSRCERKAEKKEATEPGVLLELDTALTQLVNLRKAFSCCGTGITRARVTAYKYSLLGRMSQR